MYKLIFSLIHKFYKHFINILPIFHKAFGIQNSLDYFI